ncbi:MAG TPA: GxxExxY protein [Patescibacteria group bacterium]|nr:GxxExxY protein [Patescibacteria group bacterium]
MDKKIVKDFLYEKESYEIRGACFEVWKQLGGAFKESVVDRALKLELENRGLKVDSQARVPIFYKGERVGEYIPDFVINGKIILEIKSKPFIIKEDERQFWRYLKGSSYKLGFLVNFGSNELDIRRRIYDEARQKSDFSVSQRSHQRQSASTKSGFTLMELVLVIAVLGVIAGIGMGSYGNFFRQSSLTSSANEITSTLRQAQTNSQASSDGFGWAVHFDDMSQGANANRFILYRGNCSNDATKVCRVDGQCTNPGTCQNIKEETSFTPSTVEISSVTSVNGYPDVIFTRPTGKTVQSFDITVQLKGGAQSKTINISTIGKIE